MSESIQMVLLALPAAGLILIGVAVIALVLDWRAKQRWMGLYDEFVDLSAEVIRWNLMVELRVFLDNHEEIDTPEKTNHFLRFARDIKEADLEKAYDKYLYTMTTNETGAAA